jgi:hypothetical protein
MDVPILMKLGIHIMTTEAILMNHFLYPSQQSSYTCLPLALQGNCSQIVTAETTFQGKDFLSDVFYAVHSYQMKTGN